MTRLRNVFALICGLTIIASCSDQKTAKNKQSQTKKGTPKNIILLVGDGMGLTQISSRFFNGDNEPNFKRFKHIGLIKTSSGSDLITDSAAGATAFSTGEKSYNGAVGTGMDSLAIQTILEKIANHNISSGLVSTSSITHATPASFFAHVKLRSMEEDIASQLSYSSVDFFAGGGKKFFYKRKDKIDYSTILDEQGFTMDTVSLKKPANFNLEHKFGFLLADNGMPKMSEQRGDFLTDATQLGLEYLSQNKKGFFLLVEGSQIDWGGHANDANYLIQEVIDFDKAIGAALDFAEKDGNTLVIVTADHETGGFALSSDKSYNKIKGTFSTGGHTATLIPVFAFGPGSEVFNGIYENTKIYNKIMQQTKWNLFK
jgi:alkaline phosphatase